MKIEDQFDLLVKKAESQREEKSRAKGALDQITNSMKKKGYKTIAEVKRAIVGHKKSLELINKKLEVKLAEIEEEYGKYL